MTKETIYHQNKTALGDLLQRIIIILFNFLLMATPFVFTWINEELFEFNKMIFTYTITTLIVTAWICRMMAEKKILFKQNIFDIPIFLFLISQILSTIYSIHPHTSIFGYYTRFNGGLISTFTYVALFYAFINNFEKKHLSSVIKTLMIGAVLVCAYAIPEHFGVSPSCIMITGKADVDCWKQDVQNRVFASFGQPNWLAAYLITLIPVAISLYINQKTKEHQESATLSNFYLLATSLMYTALLFTKSRSGFIGLVISLILITIVLILFSYKLLPQPKKQTEIKQTFKPILKIGIIIALISALFGTPYTAQLISFKAKTESIESIPAMEQTLIPSGGTDSGEIRKIVWRGAINVWKRYPLFGSGVETFAYSYYLDRPMEHNLVSEWDFLYNKAHNELLNILATTGLFGLASYLSIFIVLIFSYWCNLNKNNQQTTNLISLGLIAGLLALSVSNFFGFSTVVVQILLFTYLAVFCLIQDNTEKTNLIKQYRSQAKGQPKIKTSPNSELKIPYLTIIPVLICILLIRSIYLIWAADVDYATGKTLIKAGHYIKGAEQIQTAILKTPVQALYFDELSYAYAKLAVQFDQLGQSSESAELAETAIKTSDYTMLLNDRQLNFYKTRARLFINLSEIDNSYLEEAKKTLEQGLTLAPTDAKLMYYLGLVNFGLDNTIEGISNLYTATEMKPNYLAARDELATYLIATGELEAARDQYEYILENIVDDRLIRQKMDILEASMSAGMKK